MASKKIQLYTDRANTIEASPETSANCVILSDGNDLQKVLDNDLTNPTVVHEETSFKVGVGDINVSSSVVDGEVGHMVIKGKTYQNILPEPSTHVLTNNKEMFKVNEGLDPNVEIVDAVSKSAILKGQTLVNLSGRDRVSSTGFSTYENGVYKHLKDVNHYYDALMFKENNVKMFSPNKTYTFIIDSKVLKSEVDGYTEPPRQHGVIIQFEDGSYQTPMTSFQNVGERIEQKIKFTIENKPIKNVSIRTFTASLTTSGIFNGEIYKVVLLEGDHTQEDIPYFEGMQSVKMPVLTTTGKNLLNLNNKVPIVAGVTYHILENGITVKSDKSGWNNVGFNFHINPGEKYTIKWEAKVISGNPYEAISIRHKNGDNLSETIKNNDGSITFVVPDDGIVQIRFYSGSDECFGEIEYRNVQLEYGAQATLYEPYKTNILSTPEEVVLRSLPNGVKDTLNCMTGEYVQHIKEVVFDGSSDESIGMVNVNDTTLVRFNINNVAGVQTGNTNKVLCSSLPYLYIHGLSGGSATVSQECISNHSQDANVINIVIKRSRLSSVDVAGFRAYLQSNPITIQYSIATPVVKTVDLSSSGNWEKIVFDGSDDEGWVVHTSTSNLTNCLHLYCKVEDLMKNTTPFSNFFQGKAYGESASSDDERIMVGGSYHIHINILKSRLDSNEVTSFKQWLSQNPLTVWYQTTAHKDSTQVKQPIFFKDGHIIQSSGADNSLIPTLDYQAKTSNSYVMDLMKTNTKYTMKAKSASGTFTIDGASYGTGTNGTFTTPTSITNKFLVMSNKTNEEVMILEGDVVSKSIPYFKGIKSAFEDESKIEVLSTGKNLFDISRMNEKAHAIPTGVKNIIDLANNTITTTNNNNHTSGYGYMITNLKPNTPYLVTVTNDIASTGVANFNIGKRDGTSWHEQRIESIPIGATKSRIVYADNGKLNLSVNVMTNGTNGQYSVTLKNIQIEEVISTNAKSTTYQPYKSNSTKIPLLSPLRSLPDGTCDELIIDRMKKKATLIQRVGYVKFDNMDKLSFGDDGGNQYIYLTTDRHIYFANRMERSNAPAIFSHFAYYTDGSLGKKDRGDYAAASNIVFCWCMPTKRDKKERESHLRNLAKQDGVIVQYQLATPVVTEIDLENFPFVYKDGHIFLNSEIAPVVEIDYNVNQAQQIQANNETLQRHELDILDLDNLIVSFVNAEYNLRLLKFDMELSMMALAE